MMRDGIEYGKSGRCALVIPVYNEERRINSRYFDALLEIPDLHLLLIDDGSSDSTFRMLTEYGLTRTRVTVLRLSSNRGKASAILEGFKRASQFGFSIIGQTDVDQSVSVEDVCKGMNICKSNPDAYVVSGARLRLAGSSYQRDVTRMWIGRVVATMIYLITGSALYDPQSPAKWWRVPTDATHAILTDFSTRWFGEAELYMRLRETWIDFDTKESPCRVIEYPLESWVDVAGSSFRSIKSWMHVLVDFISLAVIAQRHKLTLKRAKNSPA